MEKKMIAKSMLIWLSIIPLGIANGALREGVFEPWIGIKYAMPISGIILCLSIFIVSFVFIPMLGKGTKKIYIEMGLLWFFTIIILETVLGLLMGNSFDKIINNYNITTGNLWLLAVVFTGVVPLLVAKIKRMI